MCKSLKTQYLVLQHWKITVLHFRKTILIKPIKLSIEVFNNDNFCKELYNLLNMVLKTLKICMLKKIQIHASNVCFTKI